MDGLRVASLQGPSLRDGGRQGLCRVIVVAAALLLASCGGLQPAAPYDPEIERTVSEFDKAVLRFVADMQGLSRTEKGTYGENVEFYTKWKVTLAHLRNRAIATDTGTSCGPEEDFDRILAGGFRALDDAMRKAAAAVRSADAKTLEPARDWVEERLAAVRTRFNAADAARADYERLEAKLDRWVTAANRIRGAMAQAAAGEPDAFQPAVGGCTTRMVIYLADQFEALERFHMKQKDIGIPARRAPAILIGVPVQVILRVQERKKALHERGAL